MRTILFTQNVNIKSLNACIYLAFQAAVYALKVLKKDYLKLYKEELH